MAVGEAKIGIHVDQPPVTRSEFDGQIYGEDRFSRTPLSTGNPHTEGVAALGREEFLDRIRKSGHVRVDKV